MLGGLNFTVAYQLLRDVIERIFPVILEQGFLTWLHVPLGYICLSEGVHLRLAIEDKNIFTYCLFPNSYTFVSEYYFKKSLYSYF